MLIKPSVEELLPKTENRYVLSMLTAKRARQLIDGAQPMVESTTEHKVSLAAEEINQDTIKAVRGKRNVKVPLRPEVEAERLSAELEAEAKQREVRQAENRRMVDRAQTREKVLEQAQVEADEKEVNKNLAEQFLRMVNESTFLNEKEND